MASLVNPEVVAVADLNDLCDTLDHILGRVTVMHSAVAREGEASELTAVRLDYMLDSLREAIDYGDRARREVLRG